MPSAVRLSDAIDTYLDVLKAQGASVKTVETKRSTLMRFLTVVGNIYPKNLTPRHVDDYVVAHPNWQPSTRKANLQILGTFQSFLHARKMLDRGVDLLEGRRRLRVPRKQRVFIPVREFEPLLDSVKSARDRVILAIGLYSLMRVSELVQLQWRHVDLDEGYVDIYRTKTKESDRIPISAELDQELRIWRRHVVFEMYGPDLDLMREAEPKPDWYVVCATKPVKGASGWLPAEHSVLTPEAPMNFPGRRIREVLKQAGYEGEGVNMHTLRRSGAVALEGDLRQQAIENPELGIDPIGIVQEMLGHANRVTTEIYLDKMPNKIRRDLLIKGQLRFSGGRTQRVGV